MITPLINGRKYAGARYQESIDAFLEKRTPQWEE